MKKRILSVVLAGICILSLVGCGKSNEVKYKVDYHGQEDFFKGAKDEYPEGAEVELKFDSVGTDTDYKFFVDGEPFRADWVEKEHAYIIKFTMPDHDIEVWHEAYSSMMMDPNAQN